MHERDHDHAERIRELEVKLHALVDDVRAVERELGHNGRDPGTVRGRLHDLEGIAGKIPELVRATLDAAEASKQAAASSANSRAWTRRERVMGVVALGCTVIGAVGTLVSIVVLVTVGTPG